MRILRRTVITTLITFCFFLMAMGQANIRMVLNEDSIGLGDDLKLTLKINLEQKFEMVSIKLSVLDSLGVYKLLVPEDTVVAKMKGGRIDYEITDAGRWNNSGNYILKGNANGLFYRNEQNEIENELVLKMWESGDFMILIEEMELNELSGQTTKYKPEMRQAQMIHVNIPGDSKAEEVQMAPISDILREGWHLADFTWLFVAIALTALILFMILRPKHARINAFKKQNEPVIVRPAHEIAMEKLDELKSKGLWQQGFIKEYQSELTYILREYLENRYQIKALESTTQEIVSDLQVHQLETGDIQMLKDLLQIADLVKFAKAKPDVNIHERFFQQAVDFVKSTQFVLTTNKKEID
jgi:hypothetical protein